MKKTPESFEASYRQVSPQLMARTRQLWSSLGLDLDAAWAQSLRRFKGYRELSDRPQAPTSLGEDMVFMFDQAVIWTSSLRSAAQQARPDQSNGLTSDQWLAISNLLERMIEKLAAIRLLCLERMVSPALQVARSVSEDADMIVLFTIRPKLAARFVTCRSTEETTAFWRKHIGGGRAFRAITEQIYRAGLEFDKDGSYAKWRREAMGVLGVSVHPAFAPAGSPRTSEDDAVQDCLYFVTLRLQEIFAYSHILSDALQTDIERIAGADDDRDDVALLAAAPAARGLVLEQYKWMLSISDLPKVS